MGSAESASYLRQRVVVVCAASVLAILAVTGTLAAAGFSHPTTIKYLTTVAGAALLVLVATARSPLKALVGVAIVAAPFNFVTTVAGLHITPLIAVDLVAILIWVPRSRAVGSPTLGWVAVVFALAMVPGIAGASAPGTWVIWLAVTVLTGCLAYTVASEPGGIAFVAWMIVLSGLVQAGIALWELHTHHLLNLYQQAGAVPVGREYFFTYGRTFRPVGALPDPIGLGQVLALSVPMTVALAARVRRWQGSAAILVLAGVGATALVLSLSRMSLIGGAVGIVTVVLLLPRRRMVRTGLMLAALVGAVTAVALGANGQAVSLRVTSIFHPTSAHVATAQGDLTRERIWSAALKTAEAYPVTGVGFGNITKYLPEYGAAVTSAAHAHDTYLQFFAEGGILGLLGLLAVIGAAAVDLVSARTTNRVWVAGAAGALVGTLLSWITDVEVRYMQVSAVVAILLGLIAAIATRRERSRVHAGPDRSPRTSVGIGLQPAGAVTAPGVATVVLAAAARPRATVPEPDPSEPAGVGRLGIVLVSHEDGGAERYVRMLADGALARGIAVDVAFPALSATAALREDLLAMGASYEALSIPTARPQGTTDAARIAAAETFATLRWLRRVAPSATVTILPHPDQSPGIAFATAVHRARSVASVHAVPPGVRFGSARRGLYSLCRRLGQRWVAVSFDNRDRLASALHWPADAIDVVYNGVRTEPGTDTDRSEGRQAVRDELGIEPQAKLLMTVGRLHRQKGYDVIADSIPEVIAEHADTRWLWVGDGPYRDEVSERLHELGVSDRVTLLGRRDDVPRLLAAADVFVLTSRHEGAPFALLEALATGLPVIVSDSGSFRELVDDGVEGRLVPVGDPSALAEATRWMLAHPDELESMSNAARRRALACFSAQRMIEETLELLGAEASSESREPDRSTCKT